MIQMQPSKPLLTLALTVAALALIPASSALAEEALPDGRVFEKVTPTGNQDADVYVPLALPSGTPVSEGIETRASG